jgi:hypothetical protein
VSTTRIGHFVKLSKSIMDFTIAFLSSWWSKYIYGTFNLETGRRGYALGKVSLYWKFRPQTEVLTFIWSAFDFFRSGSTRVQTWSKLFQTHGKLANCVLEMFPTKIRPPSLYILEDHCRLRYLTFNRKKHNAYLTSYLQTLVFSKPLCLSTRFIGILDRRPCRL